MSETVRLVGGPADGRELVILTPCNEVRVPMVTGPAGPIERAVYRRYPSLTGDARVVVFRYRGTTVRALKP